MPEVILPCPRCGSLSIGLCSGSDGITHEIYNQALCTRCGVHGPRAFANEIAAIAAWNALPRALTWTHEPPKVAGKYWWRPVGKKIGRIRDMFVRNGEVGFLDHNDRFIKDTGDGQWAGPISPPID